MNEAAKERLKKDIDNIRNPVEAQLTSALKHAKALVSCQGIMRNEEVKGGRERYWKVFQGKLRNSNYLYALYMAALVDIFKVWTIEDYEIEMYMEYAFCLNREQQERTLQTAKEMLTPDNVNPGCKQEDITKLLVEREQERNALEQHFELEVTGDKDLYVR